MASGERDHSKKEYARLKKKMSEEKWRVSGVDQLFKALRISVKNRWLLKYPKGLDSGSAALRDLAELMQPIDSLESEIKAMLEQYPAPE